MGASWVLIVVLGHHGNSQILGLILVTASTFALIPSTLAEALDVLKLPASFHGPLLALVGAFPDDEAETFLSKLFLCKLR